MIEENNDFKKKLNTLLKHKKSVIPRSERQKEYVSIKRVRYNYFSWTSWNR